MWQTVLLFAGLILLLVIAVYYSRYRMKKTIGEVVLIMRRFHALDEDSAKTQAELGLAPATFLVRVTSLRDYKPYAMQVLMEQKVLQMTDDGRLYLSEETLSSSNLAELVPPPR